MVRRSTFDRLLDEMMQIRYRLDDIEAAISTLSPKPIEISESELFSLPDHLRKTYLTVISKDKTSKGKTSATEVSNLTGRCRAMESNYLNQLTRMGWLTKHRDSKTIHFSPISKEALKERLKE